MVGYGKYASVPVFCTGTLFKRRKTGKGESRGKAINPCILSSIYQARTIVNIVKFRIENHTKSLLNYFYIDISLRLDMYSKVCYFIYTGSNEPE